MVANKLRRLVSLTSALLQLTSPPLPCQTSSVLDIPDVDAPECGVVLGSSPDDRKRKHAVRSGKVHHPKKENLGTRRRRHRGRAKRRHKHGGRVRVSAAGTKGRGSVRDRARLRGGRDSRKEKKHATKRKNRGIAKLQQKMELIKLLESFQAAPRDITEGLNLSSGNNGAYLGGSSAEKLCASVDPNERDLDQLAERHRTHLTRLWGEDGGKLYDIYRKYDPGLLEVGTPRSPQQRIQDALLGTLRLLLHRRPCDQSSEILSSTVPKEFPPAPSALGLYIDRVIGYYEASMQAFCGLPGSFLFTHLLERYFPYMDDKNPPASAAKDVAALFEETLRRMIAPSNFFPHLSPSGTPMLSMPEQLTSREARPEPVPGPEFIDQLMSRHGQNLLCMFGRAGSSVFTHLRDCHFPSWEATKPTPLEAEALFKETLRMLITPPSFHFSPSDSRGLPTRRSLTRSKKFARLTSHFLGSFLGLWKKKKLKEEYRRTLSRLWGQKGEAVFNNRLKRTFGRSEQADCKNQGARELHEVFEESLLELISDEDGQAASPGAGGNP